MTENDWDLLLGWNNDPEVMKHVDSEGFHAAQFERDSVYLPMDLVPRVLLRHRC